MQWLKPLTQWSVLFNSEALLFIIFIRNVKRRTVNTMTNFYDVYAIEDVFCILLDWLFHEISSYIEGQFTIVSNNHCWFIHILISDEIEGGGLFCLLTLSIHVQIYWLSQVFD